MSDRPIAGIAVCWVLGYLLAYAWPMQGFSLYLTAGAGVLCCIVLLYNVPGKMVLAGILIITAAAGIYGEHDRHNRTSLSLSAGTETEVRLLGRIAAPVKVDGDRVSFQAEAASITHEGVSESPPNERFVVTVRLQHKTEQDTASQWQRGDRVELTGTMKQPADARNFGGFDYRRYLRYQHVHWQITAKGLGSVTVIPPDNGEWGTWLPLRLNDRFRGMLAHKVDMLFPQEQSGFMQGMLIGLTDEIDPQQFDRFSRLGLTHIIAISGLNVAIFLACVVWLLRRLGLTRETYLLTAISLIPFYIAFTGASPSVVRAGIMAIIALYAAYRSRMKDGLHIALIAGLGMLIWDPYYLVDVSFQLSYLVTLGIMIGVPPMNKLLSIRHQKLRDALSITIVAQLISFPVSIYYFNQFSLLSLAANLILVPVFSVFVMPVGTIAMIATFVSFTFGQWVAWTVVKVNGLLFLAVEWLSRWDGFQTLWPSPQPAWIVMYYGLLAGIGWSLHIRREKQTEGAGQAAPMLYTDKEAIWQKRIGLLNRTVLLPVSIGGFVILLWLGYTAENGGSEGRVQFLDVGQGDSILIRSPDKGHAILVDGGGTVTFRKPGEEWKERKDPYEVGRKLLVPLLKKRGVQVIDEIVLTHQDADHYGGLQAVLEQIPVRRLLFNGTLNPNKAVEKLFLTALDKGTELVEASAGDTLKAGEQTTLFFLYPLPDAATVKDIRLEKDQNPTSVVFLMEMAGTRWLFTGDMDQASERRLLEQWSVVPQALAGAGGSSMNGGSIGTTIAPVDVLKIAHHGSKTATSEVWLTAWKPKHAVISVGLNNIYRHPNAQVLDRLAAHAVSVHRTDRFGEVQMSVKDGQIRMRTKLQDAADLGGTES